MNVLPAFGRGAAAPVRGLWAGCPAVHAHNVVTRELQVRELAPGVVTIRHPDPTDDFPDGNTTVVIGSREVLVIDTGYLPYASDQFFEWAKPVADPATLVAMPVPKALASPRWAST